MTAEIIDPEIFKAGAAVVFELRERTKAKFTSFFRGMKNRNYLIIDHPAKDGRLVPLADDDACIVRFIHEGEIIGFRTKIMAIIRSPVPLVFLHFPQNIETSRLRKSERYPVRIDAVCAGRKLEGQLESYPRDMVLNLSAGGCLVEAFESFEKGRIIFLSVFLPEHNQVNDVEVEVKRIEKKGDKFLIGLEFADLLDPGYEEIKGFLQLLEAYQVRT